MSCLLHLQLWIKQQQQKAVGNDRMYLYDQVYLSNSEMYINTYAIVYGTDLYCYKRTEITIKDLV